MNKTVRINILSKEYPKFLSKEVKSNEEQGYITCEVELSKNDLWEGRVVSISSNGNYIVELLKQLNT